MIWQTKSTLIVMLGKWTGVEVEERPEILCHEYFPFEKGAVMESADFMISC
jgi:hypothetical protein